MWKKQDDLAAAQSDLVASDNPDLASLGDALVRSSSERTAPRQHRPARSPKACA